MILLLKISFKILRKTAFQTQMVQYNFENNGTIDQRISNIAFSDVC